MSWLDRAFGRIGLMRVGTMLKGASFAGARSGRLLAAWVAGILSPDREIQYNLRRLRARARDLVRNNPWAAGFIEELADNIVGPEGIALHAQLVDQREEPREKENWRIEDAWTEWGNPEHASADGQDSWVDLERLAIKTIAIDGEVFFRELRGYDNDFGYALQILDADLLDETFDQATDENGVRIRMGIEQNKFGRPLAYHFWQHHPTEPGFNRAERIRIPASEIIHLFVRYRANQTRGFSWFAPVLTTVHHMEGLTEAELVASRISAAKMGFVINKSPEAIQAYAARITRLIKGGEKELPRQQMETAPGIIDELAPGQEFQGFDPTHPTTAFAGFMRVILQGIARGLGTTYARLTGDLTNANYSSMRAGELPLRDRFRSLQTWMAKKLHRRVYRGWVSMALANGRLRNTGSVVPSDHFAVAWKPRGWHSVDPLKDIEADEAEVALGVNSRTNIAASRGRDYETVIDQLAQEQKYAKRAGVDIEGVRSKGPSGSSSSGERDEETETDEDEAERLALAS